MMPNSSRLSQAHELSLRQDDEQCASDGGRAMTISPIRFVDNNSNLRPARTTNTSPSSLGPDKRRKG
jgi:hypothetical protein